MKPKNRILTLRTAKGLSQKDLGTMVGVTHTQIQRLETGKRELREGMIWRLAGALECHPGELFLPTRYPKTGREFVEDWAPYLDNDDWKHLGKRLAPMKGHD